MIYSTNGNNFYNELEPVTNGDKMCQIPNVRSCNAVCISFHNLVSNQVRLLCMFYCRMLNVEKHIETYQRAVECLFNNTGGGGGGGHSTTR